MVREQYKPKVSRAKVKEMEKLVAKTTENKPKYDRSLSPKKGASSIHHTKPINSVTGKRE